MTALFSVEVPENLIFKTYTCSAIVFGVRKDQLVFKAWCKIILVPEKTYSFSRAGENLFWVPEKTIYFQEVMQKWDFLI